MDITKCSLETCIVISLTTFQEKLDGMILRLKNSRGFSFEMMKSALQCALYSESEEEERCKNT